MLVLTRKSGQKILLGDDIVITVLRVGSKGEVRIGVEAPDEMEVWREEVRDRMSTDWDELDE